MTVKQFNKAVDKIQTLYPNLKVGNRFTSTISGKVYLHQEWDNYEFKSEDFPIFRKEGLVLSYKHFFSSKPMSDVPSEYEKWDMPAFERVPFGEIPPSQLTERNKILFNDNFIAYNLEGTKGFLSLQEGAWGGYGRSDHQEFIKWLIHTGKFPF